MSNGQVLVYPGSEWNSLNTESDVWRGVKFTAAMPIILVVGLFMVFIVGLVILSHYTRDIWGESEAETDPTPT